MLKNQGCEFDGYMFIGKMTQRAKTDYGKYFKTDCSKRLL